MTSVFLIMDIRGKIQKFSTASTKKRITNSFRGTFFNRHWIQYDFGAFNTEFSNVYFFLPSITDRSEDINRYMGSINLVPIDISEDNFEVKGEISFDSSKLDYNNPRQRKNETGCTEKS